MVGWRHVVLPAAFLLEPEPAAFALGVVVVDGHRHVGADAGEGEEHAANRGDRTERQDVHYKRRNDSPCSREPVLKRAAELSPRREDPSISPTVSTDQRLGSAVRLPVGRGALRTKGHALPRSGDRPVSGRNPRIFLVNAAHAGAPL